MLYFYIGANAYKYIGYNYGLGNLGTLYVETLVKTTGKENWLITLVGFICGQWSPTVFTLKIMFFNWFPHYLQCTLVEFAVIQHHSLMTVKDEGNRLLAHFPIRIFAGNAFHMTKAFHDF